MRRVGWRLGWARLKCEFTGHVWAPYIKGSYRLECTRCDFVGRI